MEHTTTKAEVEHFANTICKACGFCGNNLTQPFFCLESYRGNKKRFLKIIKHLNTELVRGRKSAVGRYSTFVAFCGLFCNTDRCPGYNNRCRAVAPRIQCYGLFVDQWAPGTLTYEIKCDIIAKYGSRNLRNIGSNFVALKDPTSGLKKGQRRSINKSISKAHKAFAAASKSGNFNVGAFSKNMGKKVKDPTTTIFYNDNDKEWEEELKVILGGL